MSEPGSPARLPFRLDPSVSYGNIFSALATAIFGLWIVMGWMTRVDATEKAWARIEEAQKTQRADIAEQMRLFREETFRRISEMASLQGEQIHAARESAAGVPDLRARVAEHERRLDGVDNRMDAQGRRIETIDGKTVQNGADIVNILRVCCVGGGSGLGHPK